MIRRPIESLISVVILIFVSPALMALMAALWARDLAAPILVVTRIGQGGRSFRVAIMRATAPTHASGQARLGRLDRLAQIVHANAILQLLNVVAGTMSLVGPRPSLPSEAVGFTAIEKRLFDSRPGIVDFAAIIFADECEILRGSADPELDYNRLIRPWKSRLGLFYLENRSLWLDWELFAVASIAIVSRAHGLSRAERLLTELEAPTEIKEIAARRATLTPCPPPGAARPVTADDLSRALTV